MTKCSPKPPYRVIQWATGNVGAEALRAILGHPALELAGVRVFSKEKDGVDAGEIAGTAATGVRATRDFDAILACEADCVCYMPRHAHLDEVCALLASGKNVVATPFLFYAHALPDADRSRVESACHAGRSSLYGTGIHPGFVGMVLPLALSGMVRRIEKLTIQERANWSFYDSPRITFDNMRFGRPPEEATLEANPFARFNSGLFQEQIHLLAAAFHAELDEITEQQMLEVATTDQQVRAGHLPRGGVSGQRYVWQGIANGKSVIEIETLWTLGAGYPESWPTPRDGWTVTLEGDPSLRTHFLSAASFSRRDLPIEAHVHAADIATALQAVNAIPALCDAAPGIRTPLDIPLVRSATGFAG